MGLGATEFQIHSNNDFIFPCGIFNIKKFVLKKEKFVLKKL